MENIEIRRESTSAALEFQPETDFNVKIYRKFYQPEPKHRKRMLLTVVMDITARTVHVRV